ncbi:similar to Saccharomyces cerevisiae YLR005W SSL1 Component of the core form of RNA polymerase transcription factor TFIIH [Maudiozyma saulgeensis]|uniref:General transcription and DNA repair factor IIH n=1 Tax=Maudiozyma saulgeensis TaxID=1789683 RepID=A0A1X7QZ35_9SACH|nr:similar to Saccharomyces cerevisiae YLR005W SSL1 Component of the core form of RNA polymerase transcription factor TFIIH [Kazachstania saulgeensis]
MPPRVVASDSDDEDDINVSSRRQKRQVHFDSNAEEPKKEKDVDLLEDNEGRLNKQKKRKRKKTQGNENLQGTNGGYAWEDEIKRSWDLVTVDEEADMTSLVASLIDARKKRAAKRSVTPYQRGIIRTLILTLDCSESMTEKDLRPTRHAMMIQYSIDFIHDFFDQNPISQVGIVIMRNGLAQLVSQVSGNPQDHIDALKKIRKQEPKGNPSLQNALEMARGLLLPIPSHCTREVLLIFGSLSSTDPSDIHQTITSLVEERIRCKVIGLSAQVAICKELCKQTNYGDESFYKILLDETHFKELFDEAVVPLPVNRINKGFTLVKMGFPTRVYEDTPTFCSCHSRLVYGGYFCPNCHNKVCSLPTVCPCCDLMLILSTHLARSYHHLMPLKTFSEVPVEDGVFPTENCFSCQKSFPTLRNNKTGKLLTSSRYRCSDCSQDFCIDCDVFIHEILHSCPGCESKPTI